MSAMRKRAILKCVCCTDGLCYTMAGIGAKYHTGITAAAYGLTATNGHGAIVWSATPGWGSHELNHRLLVWTSIAVTSNTIPSSVGSPDYVLNTKGGARYSLGHGPFWDDWPTNTVALDYEPFWYSGCGKGGYENLGSIDRVPTGTQLNTAWSSSPIPDGTYKMLVEVEIRRHYKYTAPRPSAAGGIECVPLADCQYTFTRISMQG